MVIPTKPLWHQHPSTWLVLRNASNSLWSNQSNLWVVKSPIYIKQIRRNLMTNNKGLCNSQSCFVVSKSKQLFLMAASSAFISMPKTLNAAWRWSSVTNPIPKIHYACTNDSCLKQQGNKKGKNSTNYLTQKIKHVTHVIHVMWFYEFYPSPLPFLSFTVIHVIRCYTNVRWFTNHLTCYRATNPNTMMLKWLC